MREFCGSCLHTNHRKKEGYTIHRPAQGMAAIAKRALRRIQFGIKTGSKDVKRL